MPQRTAEATSSLTAEKQEFRTAIMQQFRWAYSKRILIGMSWASFIAENLQLDGEINIPLIGQRVETNGIGRLARGCLTR